ncbi:PITH domain-containing protein [Mycena sanguinolenta]|uniref:PITH domain-containing protein n=1 Tax=Mycena sanguinolenta TaxID=230812 RepID=A0A8H6XNN5_9AGAR|nr:PITH domain-containing protein [Mycena sanguinolenta]
MNGTTTPDDTTRPFHAKRAVKVCFAQVGSRGVYAPTLLASTPNHPTIVDFADADTTTPNLNISLLEGETAVVEYPFRCRGLCQHHLPLALLLDWEATPLRHRNAFKVASIRPIATRYTARTLRLIRASTLTASSTIPFSKYASITTPSLDRPYVPARAHTPQQLHPHPTLAGCSCPISAKCLAASTALLIWGGETQLYA